MLNDLPPLRDLALLIVAIATLLAEVRRWRP